MAEINIKISCVNIVKYPYNIKNYEKIMEFL